VLFSEDGERIPGWKRIYPISNINSRDWDQYVRAATWVARRRLIMECTVSTCQRWP